MVLCGKITLYDWFEVKNSSNFSVRRSNNGNGTYNNATSIYGVYAVL
jgi:hypothetical protein